MLRLAFPLLALLISLLPASVLAQPCPVSVEAWSATCETGDGHPRPRACPPGHVVFDVGAEHLGVDVSLVTEGAFIEAGGLGASPLGNYADWSDAPDAHHAALDALVACLRASPSGLREALAEAPLETLTRAPVTQGTSLPWPLFVGLVLIGLLVQRLGARDVARRLVVPLGLGLAAFLLRLLLVDAGYFHQNGQGPVWVAQALGEPSEYGPGYAQLFGLASLASDADTAVFLMQGLLSGLGVAATFVIGERLGDARVGWALALAAAMSPMLARLANSESYFGAQGSLLLLATAILVVTNSAAVEQRLSSRGMGWRALGPLTAGALVAQAALVHPIGWVPAALVPTALLLTPASRENRLKHTALAALLVGLMVIVLAGPSMLGVIQGRLGETWMGPANARVGGASLAPIGWIAVLVFVTLWLERARPALPLVLAFAVLVTFARTDLLNASLPYAHHAYLTLFLGPLAACIAALTPRKASGRDALAFPAIVLLVSLLVHAATRNVGLYRATDALEGDLFRTWRNELPQGAVVTHLERAGRHVLMLPLRHQRRAGLRTQQPLPDLTALGADVFYYRSGVCTTPAGRPVCEAVEQGYVLTELHTASLPARPSIYGLDYDEDEVRVGLYRVVDRR